MLEDLARWVSENMHLLYRYVAALAVVALFYYVSKVVSKPVSRLGVTLKPEVVHNLERLVRFLFVLAGFVVALSIVGIDLGGLLIAAGFTGLVVGLAAQQTLGNFFSGLALILEGRLKVGDSVRIGSDGGVVESVGLMSTTLRLWSGEVLTVPNSALMSSSVYNFSKSVARRVDASVGVSYESDVDRAIEVIRNVLWRSEAVLAEPEPQVLVDSFGESSVNLVVRFWVPSQLFVPARSAVLRDIRKALEAEGIEIPYPMRVVWLRESPGSRAPGS